MPVVRAALGPGVMCSTTPPSARSTSLGSAALLLLLAPLLLIVAALVKLKSPGPVFFRQVRVGQMMKPFTMLKFRTMHVNADSRFIRSS